MKKQLQIRIQPDGTIVAETIGVKGSKCTDYIKVIEELLSAKTIDSSFTEEYYQSEVTDLINNIISPSEK